MNNEMLNRLYNSLPRIYRTLDVEQQFQLKRFLEILISGGLKPSYDETKGLLNLIDVDKAPVQYLPYLASSLGFAFPYDLDEQTQRTYIKNAVMSYKIKGTKKALEFMVRELTRFKTQVDVFEPEKRLDIILEVDMTRQDFNQVVEKVDFLVREYAPPYKEYNLINTFLWEEIFYPRFALETETITIKPPIVDLTAETNGWFMTNDTERLTNSLEIVTGFGEFYELVRADEMDEKVQITDDESFMTDTTYEEILPKIIISDTEIYTVPKAEELPLISMSFPLVDYMYESGEWFGTFNGVTNETSTYSGETYFTSITEEYTELITMV